MMSTEPLIRLEPDGKAPVLTYDLPEPAVYFGNNFIALSYGNNFFREKARKKPPSDIRLPVEEIHESFDEEELIAEVQKNLKHNFANSKMFPNAKVRSGMVRVRDHRIEKESSKRIKASQDAMAEQEAEALASETERGEEDERPRRRVRDHRRDMSQVRNTVLAEEIASNMLAGKRYNVFKSLHGGLRHKYIVEPKKAEPSILLVETYRLATYLGSYGAGRIVKTFSLLPGEKTKISIRTFRQSEVTKKESSSILDSFSEESATDFEESIASEQSDQQKYDKSFQYHAEAEAKAGWGWGEARVKGGVKGGTNSSREEFSKNTSSATNKHAQKASAKREVEVNTDYEVKETEEREKSTERMLENINLSRTLNYVFRQMNQEFITILSLVDVRVAFFNGFPETKQEVTLPELDAMLEEYIVADKRKEVRSDIRGALENILDYNGKLHDDFIEERTVGEDAYLRVRKEKTSAYQDPVTETEIEVPGIILSATKNVMRTEGILVEALLGAGDALDRYANRLQELEVQRREAELTHHKAASERELLMNKVVQDNDSKRAALLDKISGVLNHGNSNGNQQTDQKEES